MVGHASCSMLRGWAGSPADGRPVEVQLLINGELAASKTASEWRPFAARRPGLRQGMCGFFFGENEIRPALRPGRNSVQVFAVGRDRIPRELQGSPLELEFPGGKDGLDAEQTERGRVSHVVNPPRHETAEKTVIILGASRGGTSMCAGLVRLLGVHMGDAAADDSSESREFQTGNKRLLLERIRSNNAAHPLWGWKYPEAYTYIHKLRSALRNPHFVVVTRDMLSVASAYRRKEGIAIDRALSEVSARYAQLLRFVRKERAPLLLLSYEKALANREGTVTELADFLGIRVSPAQANECSQFIIDSGYNHYSRFVAGVKQARAEKEQNVLKGCLGEIAPTRVLGWARFENRTRPPCVDLMVDGEYVDSTIAREFRQNLVAAGVDATGQCGFSFRLDDRPLPARAVIGVVERETGSHLSGSPRVLKPADDEQPPNRDKPFIFIHVPKTCGTSFRLAMSRRYGPRVVCDYGEKADETSPAVRATLYGQARHATTQVLRELDTLCYCGHFDYAKTRELLKDFPDRWATFVRDPVQRYISGYNHRVQRYGLSMPLEQYLDNPRLHNEQSIYLDGVDVSQLYFIGLSEHYALSLKLFAAETGIELEYLEENRALPDKGGVTEITDDLRMRIEAANARDMDLYAAARKEFALRLARHGLSLPD